MRIEDLRLTFSARVQGRPSRVLDGLSLRVEPGELLSIVGPSGCGKTSLLNVLAGLLEPSGGAVDLGGARTAMVFQRPTLMPWRTVLDNALFGLECAGRSRDSARDQAIELLERMRLGPHLSDHPHELSEGMRQRVNLARALLVEPDVLLLDEPFCALDVGTRRALHEDLLDRWAEQRMSVVLVSHALDEVAYLSDRVAVLSDKPTRLAALRTVDLPRPRAIDRAGRLAMLEVVDELERAMAQALSRAARPPRRSGP